VTSIYFVDSPLYVTFDVMVHENGHPHTSTSPPVAPTPLPLSAILSITFGCLGGVALLLIIAILACRTKRVCSSKTSGKFQNVSEVDVYLVL